MISREELLRQADELADRLIADLKAGKRESVGLGDVELEAAAIAPRDPDNDYFRPLVDWTIRRLIMRAARL